MADGLGFKTFTTGEVLTAGDTNGYLMQGILVFATEAARDAAITVPAEGQFAFTKDTNSTWYYDGAAWVASGASGDVTGITVSNGIAGTSLTGPVPALTLATTAKGDLLAGTGSNTAQALTVGANATVLTADSTTATGLKWAAAAASGMTLIQRSSFSAVANTGTTFDNIFTSTYKTYLVSIEALAPVTASNLLQMQMRYAGPTTEAGSTYYGAALLIPSGSSLPVTNNGYGGSTEANISGDSNNASKPASGELFFHGVGNSSQRATWSGHMVSPTSPQHTLNLGMTDAARIYTGLIFKSSSTNITGTIAIYGLAAS